jgi:hypothetical protein
VVNICTTADADLGRSVDQFIERRQVLVVVKQLVNRRLEHRLILQKVEIR